MDQEHPFSELPRLYIDCLPPPPAAPQAVVHACMECEQKVIVRAARRAAGKGLRRDQRAAWATRPTSPPRLGECPACSFNRIQRGTMRGRRLNKKLLAAAPGASGGAEVGGVAAEGDSRAPASTEVRPPRGSDEVLVQASVAPRPRRDEVLVQASVATPACMQVRPASGGYVRGHGRQQTTCEDMDEGVRRVTCNVPRRC